MAKKIAVLLSGCGVFDGSEIHEAVLTLLALDKAGCEVTCTAPAGSQRKTVNHLQNDSESAGRDMAEESARISRGSITPLSEMNAENYDALLIPGGFGAALNLCSFAIDGPECEVNPEVAQFITAMHAAKKPIGAMCIAPALLSRIFHESGIQLTIGKDSGVAAALEANGCKHLDTEVDDICIDENAKIVTTPAYMSAEGPAQVWLGVKKLVNTILGMC